jgi:hypothetical protein
MKYPPVQRNHRAARLQHRATNSRNFSADGKFWARKDNDFLARKFVVNCADIPGETVNFTDSRQVRSGRLAPDPKRLWQRSQANSVDDPVLRYLRTDKAVGGEDFRS